MTLTDQAVRTIPDSPPKRRIRRKHVVRFVTVIVVGALSYGIAFVSNYQPLGRSNLSRTSGDCFRSLGTFSPFRGDSFQVWELTCSKVGDKVSWSGGLENHGPIDVTVTDFPIAHGGRISPLGIISVFYARSINQIPRGAELQPFRPFVVHPGEFYWVEFRTTLVDKCDHIPERGWEGSEKPPAVQVTYKVGPFTRHDFVLTVPGLRIQCSD